MNLDEDVVFQILLRMPVRSLLRFRCVCKEWCSLIEGCVFKDSYLGLRRAMAVDDKVVGLKRTLVSGNDIPYEEMELILNNDEDDFEDEHSLKRRLLNDSQRGTYTISVTGWSGDYQSLAFSALAPLSITNDFEISGNYCGGLRIINHVNGILCFINGDSWFDITLVNPALREIRKLPIPPLFDLGGFICDAARGIGFGYDDVSDEYKVFAVVTVYEEDGKESPYKHIGIVYYLSTNSWKILGDMSAFVSSPCFDLFPCDESVFSHGSIHWCIQWNIHDPSYGILAFDVTNELFRVIGFPHGWRYMYIFDDDAMFPHLFTVDKSTIALVNSTCEMCDIQEIQVWVMKEYGDADSWTMLYSISTPPRYRKVLSFWKKDKLLLLTLNSELICCDIIREGNWMNLNIGILFVSLGYGNYNL